MAIMGGLKSIYFTIDSFEIAKNAKWRTKLVMEVFELNNVKRIYVVLFHTLISCQMAANLPK